jgi:hypothetical protein
VADGFTLDDFALDDEEGTLTCPAGVAVRLTPKGRADYGANCAHCPLRRRCTTAADGRVVVLHPHHRLLVAARAQAATDEFDAVYRRWRPMVERSLAWLTRGANRKLRYRGAERNRLWWSHRCAAVNLQRLLALGLVLGDDGAWAIA